MTEDVPSNDDLKEATEALASQMAQKRRERIKEALAATGQPQAGQAEHVRTGMQYLERALAAPD